MMDSDSSEVLAKLRSLPDRYFEEFVADLWEKQEGWTTEVTTPGPDRGVDVMGQPPEGGPKTAVQCKRYREGKKVGRPQIQQYSSLINGYSDVEGVTVVTTSDFTKNAREEADILGVNLINGEELAKLIQRHHAEDILDWYHNDKPSEQTTMSDDKPRFGDISGGGNSGGGPTGDSVIDQLIRGLVALVIIYVILNVVQVMFNIPIPLI